ncbi:hypothetical protein FQN57_000568 [Myotisia sp. PD_48]|nr:hypothetical protein FQN57_000568 [Myotisia sp. PD_48]
MGANIDPLQCFSQLSENLPLWISRVTDLTAHTAAKHTEFSAHYSRLSKGDVKQRRRKNSSLHTNREDEHSSCKSVGSISRKHLKEGSLHNNLTLKRLSRQQQSPNDILNRKRKPDGETATPDIPAVVIHYDGHTQVVLEKLVRDLGGARNNIRKGRMNSMIKFDFGRRGLPSALLSDDGIFKPTYRVTRAAHFDPKLGSTRSNASSSNDTIFDQIDKQLETAQNLCETAAHRFIRIGDCSAELIKSKDRLVEALALAEVETERLRAEAAQNQEEEEHVVEDENKDVVNRVELKLEMGSKSPMGAIEVDDASSTSSISVDMAAFRTRRFRV